MNEVQKYNERVAIERVVALKRRVDHLLPTPTDYTSTKYTGIIKSTADLAYWANIKPWTTHCAKCEISISKKLKAHNNGFCDACAEFLVQGKRCSICFKKIHGVGTFNADTNMHSLVCLACSNKFGGEASNAHGYKEGGKQSGGLRTNYRTDNVNDNNSRTLEDNR
jgi:RNase P subunit RPR2